MNAYLLVLKALRIIFLPAKGIAVVCHYIGYVLTHTRV